MEKITLVCTAHNPNFGLLEKMLDSTYKDGCLFNNLIVHHNGYCIRNYNRTGRFTNILSIPSAYNYLIKNLVDSEWVCCMADDDYFYPEALSKMIEEVHKGIDADVAHFKFNVSGFMPKEDIRGRIYRRLTGKSEYVLWEKHPITPQLLKRHGRMPAASFFRKSAWEKVGGFQGDKFHDWDLWKRMAEAGCKFKFFDHVVYNFVRRENSAWIRQNENLRNLS